VYKLDSFLGFIGDEQFHAQECYETPEFALLWLINSIRMFLDIPENYW
jgi:hypothetical protein